jgi:hypothetical protein
VKLSYTGATLATYQLPMTPFASEARGNLWLRTTTVEGDILARLPSAGVLTKYGRFLAFASDVLPALLRRPHVPQRWTRGPASFENTITIVDPRIAPVLSIEVLATRRADARRVREPFVTARR